MSLTAQDLLDLSDKELAAFPAEVRKQIELLRKQVLAANRLTTVARARTDMVEYTKLMMPHPRFPDDPARSRYTPKPIHHFLADKLQKVLTGEILRLIVSVQPRVGKSQLTSKSLPGMAIGLDPYKQIMVTGYGDDFVKEFGREVRDNMISPAYSQVYPEAVLAKGAKAADRLQTVSGGIVHFIGVGGGLTGKGADLLIIDDPIKSAEEARSKAVKDSHWQWLTKDAMSRVMGRGAIVITMTRWAEDDIVGRLTNPELGYTTEEEAAKWTVINIPAEAEADDPLGRQPGEILWPERTSLEFLRSFRTLDPAGYAALYMGRPAPPEGNFFKQEQIQTYLPGDLPKNLRYYAASDHAVSLEQRRDSTAMGVVGVDEQDNIWIMPDLVWKQLDAEDQVEAMLTLMAKYKPLAWWAEKGHISKSIGPFLKKRMNEEGIYCSVIEKTPVKDKQTRAQSIQARMSMGKVFFPRFAPWYADAVTQLLQFPNGAHDDFVDFLAWVGIGLNLQVKPNREDAPKKAPKTGTLAWVLANSKGETTQTNEQRYLQ